MEKSLEFEKERYKKALEMTLDLAKERLQNELVALYLGGSYLRGDFVPGWSDLDFTTVVKDEVWQNESLRKVFFEKCAAIRREVEVEYGLMPDLGLPHGTTYESAVLNKVNLAAFLARMEEKLVLGRDVFKEGPFLDAEKIPYWGKAATPEICNLLLEIIESKEALNKENLVKSTRGAITHIMKIAQNSLFMKGIVKMLKKEIVEAFEKEFALLESRGVVRKAYELQLSWKRILGKEIEPQALKDFIEEAKVFTRDIRAMALQKV